MRMKFLTCSKSALAWGAMLLIDSSLASGTIKKSAFGKTKSGEAVDLYTLSNGSVSVSIMTYGATIQKLSVPDRHGREGDVTLGFDDVSGYETHLGPYFGATIGRYANRIAKGTFQLDGKTYHLPINNPPNSLHGGNVGYDKRIWKASSRISKQGPSVRFTLHDSDGDQGYPGNVDAAVVFTLLKAGVLRIQYTAVSDRDTPINLTNHSYWNLKDAGRTLVTGHRLKLFANQYTPTDSTLIPTGKLDPVAGTPLDFRKSKIIGRDLAKTKGYDMNFVLSGTGRLKKAAEVIDPISGRRMEVFTTEPAIQFYSSNFLDGSFAGKNGIRYQQYAALALETQHYPDSPNHPNFPSTILRPGKVFRSTTEYRFSLISRAARSRKTGAVASAKSVASPSKE